MLAAGLLMVLFGLCLCWVSVLVGMLVRSPVAVPGITPSPAQELRALGAVK